MDKDRFLKIVKQWSQLILEKLGIATRPKTVEISPSPHHKIEKKVSPTSPISKTEKKKTTPFSREVYVPYVDLSHARIAKEILNLIPEQMARRYQVVPIEKSGSVLIVAMIDPEDQEVLELIKKTTGFLVERRITTQDDLGYVLNQYSGLDKDMEEIVKKEEVIKTVEAAKAKPVKAEDVAESAPASKIVSSFIRRAVRGRASDIHIEPQEESVDVRFRIDGVLQKVLTLPKEIQPAVISRIKILANLKIDETRLPQDGRFRSLVDQIEVDFRVSTYPTVNGEKVVLRILSRTTGILTLEQLGLRKEDFAILDENIHKAHGMILVTGPTGSGKSTTLYAIIQRIFSVGINIITLEDPVEYRLPGISQAQINAEIGFTFANGLRSILRQDPDVIMIGEIRDFETASMAVHAALTGHGVLSTLHTNDAAGAIPRLIDMKIEPFLMVSTLNAVMAQRLCRKICEACKVKTAPSAQELDLVKKELENLPKIITKPKEIGLYRGKGCDACQGTGYKGRVGIFEILGLTPAMKKLVLGEVSSDLIQKRAQKEGMITLKQDGILKAIEGVTTLEEVWRVTKD